jgi:hypothetical protein
MGVLIGREKTDMTDVDMVVGCKLQFTARNVVGEREKTDVT